MGIQTVSTGVMEKYADVIFDRTMTNKIPRFVTYMIDSKYRKVVQLKNWIKEQVVNPSDEVKAIVKILGKRETVDLTVIAVFNWVAQNITYKPDNKVWDMMEKWQTANVTVEKLTGDCEDGAILIYVLCRLLDIPSNRLQIFCGDVRLPNSSKTVGHAWLAFKPNNFPYNYAFLDWCYYYNSSLIGNRNLVYVQDKTFVEYKPKNNTYAYIISDYRNMWFCFNEEKSFTSMITNFKNRS